jgi:thiamine biosynthesis protein ThiS
MNPLPGAPSAPALGVLSVHVNGAPREFPQVRTLGELLRALELDARMVVVELNRVIVRRDALAATPLADGDQVELVHFVGGG